MIDDHYFISPKGNLPILLLHLSIRNQAMLKRIKLDGCFSYFSEVVPFGRVNRRAITLGLAFNGISVDITILRLPTSQVLAKTKRLCDASVFSAYRSMYLVDGPFAICFEEDNFSLAIFSLHSSECFNKPVIVSLESFFRGFESVQLSETQAITLVDHHLIYLHFITKFSNHDAAEGHSSYIYHKWFAVDLECLIFQYSMNSYSSIPSSATSESIPPESYGTKIWLNAEPPKPLNEVLWSDPVCATDTDGNIVIPDVLAGAPLLDHSIKSCTSLAYYDTRIPGKGTSSKGSRQCSLYWGDEGGMIHVARDGGLQRDCKLLPLPLNGVSSSPAGVDTSVRNISVLKTNQLTTPVIVASRGYSVFILNGEDLSILQEFYNVGMMQLRHVNITTRLVLIPVSECVRVHISEELMIHGAICSQSNFGIQLPPTKNDLHNANANTDDRIEGDGAAVRGSVEAMSAGVVETFDLQCVTCDPRSLPVLTSLADGSGRALATRLSTHSGFIDAVGPYDLESIMNSRGVKRGANDDIIAVDSTNDVIPDRAALDEVKAKKKARKEKKKKMRSQLESSLPEDIPMNSTSKGPRERIDSAFLSVQNALRVRIQHVQCNLRTATNKLRQKQLLLRSLTGLLLRATGTVADAASEALYAPYCDVDSELTGGCDGYLRFPSYELIHNGFVPWKNSYNENGSHANLWNSNPFAVSSANQILASSSFRPIIVLEHCEYRVQRSFETAESSIQLIIRAVVRNVSSACMRGVHLVLSYADCADGQRPPALRGRSGVVSRLRPRTAATVSASFVISPRIFASACSLNDASKNVDGYTDISVLFNVGVLWANSQGSAVEPDALSKENDALLSALAEYFRKEDILDYFSATQSSWSYRGVGLSLLRLCYEDVLQHIAPSLNLKAAAAVRKSDSLNDQKLMRNRTWKMFPYHVSKKFDDDYEPEILQIQHCDRISSTDHSYSNAHSFTSSVNFALIPNYINAVVDWDLNRLSKDKGSRSDPLLASCSDVKYVYRAFGCSTFVGVGGDRWRRSPGSSHMTTFERVVEVFFKNDVFHESDTVLKPDTTLGDSLSGLAPVDCCPPSNESKYSVQPSIHETVGNYMHKFTRVVESETRRSPCTLFLHPTVTRSSRGDFPSRSSPSTRAITLGCLIALDDSSLEVGLRVLQAFSASRDLALVPVASAHYWAAVSRAICAMQAELAFIATCWKLQKKRQADSESTANLIEYGRHGLYVHPAQYRCLLQLQRHTDLTIAKAFSEFNRFVYLYDHLKPK